MRKARDDDKIKAIVLRVNSPGGSAFGSELVRRELELARQAGKPVVVSMGDVAASGGYWISMAADEVIADEATITGSIGVVALLPTANGAMDKLGVRTGGVTTTWLAGAYDPRRAFDPRFGQLVQTIIDRAYLDFTTLAASARRTTPGKIDEVGQGRVWSGRQAVERGLVDRTGSLGDALAAAAGRAKLASGHRVQYLEAEPGRLERLLQGFGATTGHGDRPAGGPAGGLAGAGPGPALDRRGRAGPRLAGRCRRAPAAVRRRRALPVRRALTTRRLPPRCRRRGATACGRATGRARSSRLVPCWRSSVSSAWASGPSRSSMASRTVSTKTCVWRSISMFKGAPSALSAKVVSRRVSGISQTSNQPAPPASRCASATVRLAPLTAM